jgi:hypothetical protein
MHGRLENRLKQKDAPTRKHLYLRSWCGIKDDHRTFVGTEGVETVNIYTDINEDENLALDYFFQSLKNHLPQA